MAAKRTASRKTPSKKKSPKLTAAKRKKLGPKSFGVPRKKKYPIDTPNRARNALARVAQHGTDTEKAQVRKRVRAKHPSIKVGGKKTKAKS